MKRPLLVITIASMLLLATGCANRAERLKDHGFSDSYIKGDDDGCHSGISSVRGLSASAKKNMELFKSNKDYKEAWSEAFYRCKREEVEAANRKLLEKNKTERSRIKNTNLGRPPTQ